MANERENYQYRNRYTKRERDLKGERKLKINILFGTQKDRERERDKQTYDAKVRI